MKKTNRLFAAFLLVAFLVLSFALPSASAGGGTEVWVNNVYLTSGSPYWKNGNAPASAGDWNAYFNVATATLTLNNAEIDTLSDTTVDAAYQALVYADGPITVVLEGNNAFQFNGTANSTIAGIYASGALTVNGSGGAVMKIQTTSNISAYGIYGDGVLTIENGTLDMGIKTIFMAIGFGSNSGILFAGGMAIVGANGSYSRIFVVESGTLRITGGAIKGLATAAGGNAIALMALTIYLEGGEGVLRATEDESGYGILVGVNTMYVTGGDFIIAGTTSVVYPELPGDLLITGRAAYASESFGGAGESLFIALRNTTQTVPLSSLRPYRHVRFVADTVMPQTGDYTMPWLWAGLALFAMLGAAALVLKMRRRAA